MLGSYECESVDKDLKLQEVGGVYDARWLTLGCRLLGCYVSVAKPSKLLTTPANFLIHVYFPTWFEVKLKNGKTDGSKNYFGILSSTKKFPDKIGKLHLQSLERNSCFAHHENELLSMLADADKPIRQLLVNKVLSLRGAINDFITSNCSNEFPHTEQTSTATQKDGYLKTRKFVLPAINPQAKSYYEMINLNGKDVNEPPAIKV